MQCDVILLTTVSEKEFWLTYLFVLDDNGGKPKISTYLCNFKSLVDARDGLSKLMSTDLELPSSCKFNCERKGVSTSDWPVSWSNHAPPS